MIPVGNDRVIKYIFSSKFDEFLSLSCQCNLRLSVKNNDAGKKSQSPPEVTICFYHDIRVWDNREIEKGQ